MDWILIIVVSRTVQDKVVGSILHNLVKQSDRPAELQSTTVVSLLSTCKTRRQGKHS